jgi:hypothetical protein
MSEYWKSTPKYWCKHCSIYVRDTKLERANHEATGKHQGAIKRSLRDLHRNHEKEERDKDRAKREVERLNGVVSGSGSASRSGNGFKPLANTSSGSQTLTKDEQQRQLEQLTELGVNIPTELRPELALAGEWTVTSTRVLDDPEPGDDSKASTNPGARAAGVRKRDREQTEEEREEEDALKSLFKKPKKWGRDTRSAPTDEDAELDQLLSGSLVQPKKEEAEDVKVEVEHEPQIKSENTGTQDADLPAETKENDTKNPPPPLIKQESSGGLPDDVLPGPASDAPANDSEPAVVFKKRKPKNVRQK